MPTEETASKSKAAAKPKKTTTASAEKAAATSAGSKTRRSPAAAAEKAPGTSRARKPKGLDAETRHKLISQTAHFIAERRSQGGDELGDWLFAERLVDEISAALR